MLNVGCPVYLHNSLDLNYSNVQLLLKGENNNNTVNFTDDSSFRRVPTGSAASITTSTQKKFGIGSIYQTGTNQQITYATQSVWSGNALATGIWTLECWLFLPNQLSGTFPSAELANPGGNRGNTSVFPTYISMFNGNGEGRATLTSNPAANTWHHIVYQKNTTTNSATTSNYDVYFNGNRLHMPSVTSWATGNTTQTWQVGRADGAARPGKFIDEYRFTIGVVRYPGSPATIAVPDRDFGIARR